MTKRIIGLILAVAALAVIVIAAIRYNTYTSIAEPAATETSAFAPETHTPKTPVSEVQTPDSLVTAKPDTVR